MKEKKNPSRLFIRGASLLVLACALWLAMPDRLREHFAPSVKAAPMTFIVNTTDDIEDLACNVAHCSLRGRPELLDQPDRTVRRERGLH